MSNEWVFEFMCQVLQSPSWEVPVMSFIDENCAIFDNEEENKLTHMDAHIEFKTLVENLLTQHLMEVGITPEDFYEACEIVYLRRDNSDFAKKIIEQLIACDDFLTFKAIMFKRNKELELEALMSLDEDFEEEEDEELMLAKRNSFRESKEVEALEHEENEAYEQALTLSEETERLKEISLLEKEEADLQAAIALSLAMEEERLRILADREKDESKSSFESKESKEAESKNNGSSRHLSKLPPLDGSYASQLDNLRETKEHAEKVLGGMGPSSRSMGSSAGFDEYDVARRKKHLEAQRKRLLAKKQKEREQQLEDFKKQKKQTAGPQQGKEAMKPQRVSQEQGQLTFALARRMKQELIENEDDSGDVLSSLDAKLKQVEQLRRERANLLRGA